MRRQVLPDIVMVACESRRARTMPRDRLQQGMRRFPSDVKSRSPMAMADLGCGMPAHR